VKKLKEEFLKEKRHMLIKQMKQNGSIKSKDIEDAFLKVKREFFVYPSSEKIAYEDTPLSIGFNQTISQPTTIAIMLEMLKVEKKDKVLEVGSGSGYVLALLSDIVGKGGKVFGMEMVKELFEFSKKNLKKHEYSNVKVFRKDGSVGLKEYAPYDKILISAACPFIPKSLFDQLKEGGRIVAPVGDKGTQTMQLMTKKNNLPVKEENIESYFVFVPLLGKEGYKSDF